LHRFKKTDSLKSHLVELGEEIQAIAPNADVSLSLEPQSRKEGRKQKIFKLSAHIQRKRLNVFLSKTGEKVYPLILELRHEVLHRLRELKEKKITERTHRTSVSHYQEITVEEPAAG
jgi:hypothetical protein